MSLMEMTFAVLILGIVATTGGIRYANSLEVYRAQRTAERIASDIEAARHAARSRNQNISVSFDIIRDRYTLSGLVNPDRRSGAFTVALKDIVLKARLVSANFGGDAVLQFNSFGMPDSGGVLTLQAGGAVKTVTVVAGTGAVTIP
jgi:Tfp pilus assembly protein FimT